MGNEVKVGTPAPDAELLDNDLKPVKLSAYRGKVLVMASVPSLDSPVCDLETRRFNDEAANLGPAIDLLTISMDLPFAQKRWCAAEGVNKLQTLSDHRNASFGMSYGVLIKELGLLARAVFVVDKKGIIQHIDLVKEIAYEPNYEEILSMVRKLGSGQ